MFNDNLISDFKQKVNLFNSYFSFQCTPINTSSNLPVFAYKTENRLDFAHIKEEDIYIIIKDLIPNRAHGWDDISFQSSLEKLIFPVDWEKVI